MTEEVGLNDTPVPVASRPSGAGSFAEIIHDDPAEKIARASRVRKVYLRKMIDSYNALLSECIKLGIPDTYSLKLAQAISQIDCDLPSRPCPRCCNGAPDPSCICRGRGWFSKAQQFEYDGALNSRFRTATGVRTIDIVKGSVGLVKGDGMPGSVIKSRERARSALYGLIRQLQLENKKNDDAAGSQLGS